MYTLRFISIFLLLFAMQYCQAQPAGTLDISFGSGGLVTTTLQSMSKAYGVALQPDGKIVICGFQFSAALGKDAVCARYQPNGALDSTFGLNGVVSIDANMGGDDEVHALSIQSDGKIVLAGFTDDGTNKDALLCRITPNGSLDTAFGINGKVIVDFDSSRKDEIHAVQIHPLTGNIIVAGNSIISNLKAKPVVARFWSNGQLDTTFNYDGIRTLWVTALDYQYYFSAEDLYVYPNGRIAVCGWRDFPSLSWDADYWMARINSDGTMDNTFSGDGVNTYNGSFNGHDKAYSLLMNNAGNLTLAGGSFVSSLNYDASFFELNIAGSVTGVDGVLSTVAGNNEIFYGHKQDASNNYILVGSAANGANSSFLISRMSSVGVLDNTFGTGGVVTTNFGNNATNEAFDMQLQPDGKILAVGYSGNHIALARYLGVGVPQLNSLQLTSPADNATNQFYTDMLCDFTDAYLATGYEVEVDTLSNFTTSQVHPVVNSTVGLSNLLPLHTYYWRARATDGTNWGAWTSPWSFTTMDVVNSVANTAPQQSLMIYPNPCNDEIVINANTNGEGVIINFSGQVIKRISWSKGLTNVSLVGLPTGTYSIRSKDYLYQSAFFKY